jgi:hypothetical protein
MPRQYKKTRLAAAAGVVVMGLGLSAAAEAVVVVGGDNGWEVSFDGHINAFYTISDSDTGYTSLGYNVPGTGTPVGTFAAVPDIDQSRIQSGFLPAYFSFNVKSPTVGGLTATGRITFAPQIQNANVKNQFHTNGGFNGGTPGFQGSSIDTREVVVDIDGDFGTFSFGRALSIFGRQAMLKDQTLYGVGAPGGSTGGGFAGTGGGGGSSAGRIGRGFTYSNFNARFSYKTPNLNGLQVEIGIYDPSVEQGFGASRFANILDQTDTPRFEGEAKYTSAFNNGSFQLWIDGLWQDIESSASGANGDVTVSGFGAGADIKYGAWNLLGYYYTGEGLGRSLQFVGGTRCDVTGNICEEADADGYLVQGSYTFNDMTKVTGSYGESNEDSMDANPTAALAQTRDAQLSMWTVGVYHDINSWMKLIAEYSNAENEFGDVAGSLGADTEADVFSLGTFFFW